MTGNISFGSDNHSGVHPKVLMAMSEANRGHHRAYGADAITDQAQQLFKETFGSLAETFFVFNGTAANTLAVRTICKSYEAVVVCDLAHLNTDECGAPEFVGGNKILSFPSRHQDGKLEPSVLETLEINPQNPHRVLPRMLSLTQATELGTVYSARELQALCEVAHRRNLLVHMDGARLANAAAHLGCELRELTTEVGVDVLSFGGTKNGLLCAEALVFLTPGLSQGFEFIRKQSMQLASKMRYLSAQFLPYLGDKLWQSNALKANQTAQYLRARLAEIPGVGFPLVTQANEVFVRAPLPLQAFLLDYGKAYLWDHGLVRLVCSFDSTSEHVDSLMEAKEAWLRQTGGGDF